MLKKIEKIISDNSSEILLGVGLAGMLTSTVLAVKATPRVHEILEEEKNIRRLESEPDMKVIDVVKLSWKPYLPAALSYGASAACILGSYNISTKRNATLLAACKLGETALKEYREKVIEVVGEEKEKEIKSRVNNERINRELPEGNIIITGTGTTLCFDTISGRYFQSHIDRIKKIQNELNHRLLNDSIVSLNEFYHEIGLESTDIGEELGWNIEDGLIEVFFDSHLNSDGQPCMVVDHYNRPKSGFHKIG